MFIGSHDRAVCFQCGGGLKEWLRTYDQWVQHAAWFPFCVYVTYIKGPSFIRDFQKLRITKKDWMNKKHGGTSCWIKIKNLHVEFVNFFEKHPKIVKSITYQIADKCCKDGAEKCCKKHREQADSRVFRRSCDVIFHQGFYKTENYYLCCFHLHRQHCQHHGFHTTRCTVLAINAMPSQNNANVLIFNTFTMVAKLCFQAN